MEKWQGSAAVCINNEGKLLMVLQGKPEEKKKWSVPSGGKEPNESFAQCCIREVWEETGYEVEVVDEVFVKKCSEARVEVPYFCVNVIGGEEQIQDPDQLIYEIAWKNAEELKELELSFPEDRNLLIYLMEKEKRETCSRNS
ncbi:NUDIX hydrolase [Bacillus shivajii]|uniref:NUDIX hydrolase n=1 Tax=Bacillus shivajii TaxID=1983719 RepID=UPI001CFC2139|nr:NUDIX hydrolase [Bacillus shivajii]UCZ53438.1 NUDIX hydrolase [Bacillus shivajii]